MRSIVSAKSSSDLAELAERNLHVQILQRRRRAGKSTDQFAFDTRKIFAAAKITFDGAACPLEEPRRPRGVSERHDSAGGDVASSASYR
jgi:hypothetical protein